MFIIIFNIAEMLLIALYIKVILKTAFKTHNFKYKVGYKMIKLNVFKLNILDTALIAIKLLSTILFLLGTHTIYIFLNALQPIYK